MNCIIFAQVTKPGVSTFSTIKLGKNRTSPVFLVKVTGLIFNQFETYQASPHNQNNNINSSIEKQMT